MPQRGTPFLAFFGKPGPKFDPVKFNWIGSLNNETGVITLWHTAKVKTLKDALEKESLIGGSGPNDTESYPALMDNTIGTKFRIISGYPSTTAISLAMERGEVDGLSQSWSSLKSEHPDWVKNKTLSILVQVGSEKHPDLPDVPTIMEFVKNPEHKAAMIAESLGFPADARRVVEERLWYYEPNSVVFSGKADRRQHRDSLALRHQRRHRLCNPGGHRQSCGA